MQNLNTINSANLKEKTLAIVLILVLTISAAAAILPLIKAQTNIGYSYTPTLGSDGLWNIPTFAGITASPNPVGVDQTISVIMIIELLPPSFSHECTSVSYGGWQGYELYITDPNGTTTSQGPYESDVSGTYQVEYTPDTVGTYSFYFTFPGEVNNNGYIDGTASYGNYSANFMASTSKTVTVTVQQAPLQGFNEAPVPLPTQYWTQPIDDQNRYWNAISGPWFSGYNATGPYNPFTYPVLSAHIIWTYQANPIQAGIVGGLYGSDSWGGVSGVSGTGYPEVGRPSSPIIMGGYIYYNSPVAVLQGMNAEEITPAGGVGSSYTTQNNLTNYAVSQFSCMSLQTGKILWTSPGSISYGQIIDWRDQQQRMCLGYLWYMAAGCYKMYDAVNGQLLAQWFNQPAGATVLGTGTNDTLGAKVQLPSATTVSTGTVVNEPPNPLLIGQLTWGGEGGGAMLVYITGRDSAHNVNSSWLACWNSTLALESYSGDVQVWPILSSGAYPLPTSTSAFGGPAYFPSITDMLNTPLNWEDGIMWNYTIPAIYLTNANGVNAAVTPSIIGTDLNWIVLSGGKSSARATGTEVYQLEGFPMTDFVQQSLGNWSFGANLANTLTQSNPLTFWGQTATPSWNDNLGLPAYDQTYPGTATLRNGGYIIYGDTTLEADWAISESTGALLWTAYPYQNDFAMQSTSAGTVAFGVDYINGYDGYMHAINMTTGAQIWCSVTRLGGLNIPEEAYPASGSTVVGTNIQNGVVYCSTSKAYETVPLDQGHCLYAYDAATGAQLWNISGEFSVGAVDDGILLGYNSYDGLEFAFGPGQTATTVEAPMTTLTAGQPVIIQGTVTDQTPGIAQGTPAISDTWMTPWMEYLYMDQPYPTQATGVNVQLTAVDPNGNYIVIGNATSDLTGAYSFQWTPPNVPGKYTIVSTFSADNSYYGSSGECAATVVSPAAPAAASTPTPASMADTYFVPAIAGLFVLIIIVAIVLALLMLRKRP